MEKDKEPPVTKRQDVDRPPADKTAGPRFIRGTIDPATKKGR